MKPKILKLSTFVLLLFFIGTSCQKDEIEYADESIEIYSSSGIAIYKTKGNYLNYVTIEVDSANNITTDFGYTIYDPRVLINEKKDTIFNNRWQLKTGYIVATEVYIDQIFTNISIGEYVCYTSKYNSGAWSKELLVPRIIDRDPFVSFYFLNGLYQKEMKFSLGELNEMIENGTLEEHFEKLK